MSIKERKEVPQKDQWDLSVLFVSEEAWEKEFQEFKDAYPQLGLYKGQLGSSAEKLLAALTLSEKVNRMTEKLGQYAHLKLSQDVADTVSNDRLGRFNSAVTAYYGLLSFWEPEIQSISDQTMKGYLDNPSLSPYKISLEKLLYWKPHILSESEEKVLAMGSESRGTIAKTFSSLTNADLNFGTITLNGTEQPLTQSSFSLFLQNPDRKVRRQAYHQFYSQFEAHANTLGALYAGNVQQDVFLSKIRGFSSSRARALFPDKVPESVYDNLVTTVTNHLPLLHRYYGLRKKLLSLDTLHHSDVYAPLMKTAEMSHTFDEACEAVLKAVAPLGQDYQETLRKGLYGGWVDRYENKGKRSGAFSSGAYEGYPYILLNFQEQNLRDVFTLAHEAGHSMHSWYSVHNNPFSHYDYTIFEAEVASTVNEQLLARHFLNTLDGNDKKLYIISKQIEDTVATLFRQTMFAEFEHKIHVHCEEGGGLTLDFFRNTYRKLLEKYFGSEVEFEEFSDLEGLRIPHFYNAFYVYKYATGLSAAMALSKRILEGGEKEKEQYLNFLKSGGSKYPLESLKLAGVDMSVQEPIELAMKVFEGLLDRLEGS